MKKSLAKLPNTPGIYLFYNKEKELIYVGKATSLRNRVRSYFAGPKTSRPIEQLIHEVANIKVKQTDSVLEAIILEANYIKTYKPVYNVMGKDNRSWNYITISKDEYPIVGNLREHELNSLSKADVKKKYQYLFGPYPGLNTKATMKLLGRLFHIAPCQKKKYTGKPCLYAQMGKCLGLCTKEITPAAYKTKVITPLVTFLKGNKKMLLRNFKKRMQTAAKNKEFEEAARLRDQIKSLMRIQDIALINRAFFDDHIGAKKGKIIKIEGYDISNLGATGKVGSLVVFMHGEADKKQYRKFKIKTVKGQSDVDCLDEVLRRRLRHHEWRLPELFLIDGGKPQVNRVQSIFDELGIQIPIVGIAKGPDRKKNEFTFTKPTATLTKWVKKNEETLVRVRDEAHRFAISYQKKLRKMK